MHRVLFLMFLAATLSGCGMSIVAFSPEPPDPAVTILSGYELSPDERCEIAFASLRSASATDLERGKAGQKMRDLHCGLEPPK